MNKIALYTLVLFALTSCAVPVTPITGSNGKPSFSLKCTGMGRSREDCLIKAGELCPKGYTVLDDSQQINGAITSQNTIVLANQNYIVISCKN